MARRAYAPSIGQLGDISSDVLLMSPRVTHMNIISDILSFEQNILFYLLYQGCHNLYDGHRK